MRDEKQKETIIIHYTTTYTFFTLTTTDEAVTDLLVHKPMELHALAQSF